jgi:hypothetical protein
MNNGATRRNSAGRERWLARIGRKFKYGLTVKYLLDRLTSLGIEINPYYLVVEGLFLDEPPFNETDYAMFEVAFLDEADMTAMAAIPGRAGNAEELRARLLAGQRCLGVRPRYEAASATGDHGLATGEKSNGILAAFTWFSLDRCSFKPLPFELACDEAYLFDAYTQKEYRGRALLPYARYRCYQALVQLGRTRCYSISEYFNKPSLQFKRKLGARVAGLYLFVEIGRRWRWNWRLWGAVKAQGRGIIKRP